MEPEQMRDCPSTISNCVAVDLSPECPQQQSRFSASSLVQDLIETIMEFEEEAMVTHHPYHQGLQLLRDSLPGLCREEQLQGDEDLLTTAADFLKEGGGY